MGHATQIVSGLGGKGKLGHLSGSSRSVGVSTPLTLYLYHSV
jgi:hypothetical protein